MSRASRAFDSAELDAIRDAVTRAEARTSGEIVTYVVGRCDEYPEARWRGATLGAMAGVLVAAAVHRMGGYWGGDPLLWIGLPSLVGLLVGLFAVEWITAVKRRLIARSTMARRVERRALAAFVEEEVFNTRQRTGILLFLTLFEHRALVLGDEGINRLVDPSEWQEIVDGLSSGLRAGDGAQAVVRAVELCGELLARHRVDPADDDVDELPDTPRVRDR